jgi:SWI/SNF-related matrix-associated actin-dependent regulator of chromatin subfamily A3
MELESTFSGAFLGDEMGLGKTYQMLAVIFMDNLQRLPRCTLIVAPTNVQLRWLENIQEHCQSQLFAKCHTIKRLVGLGFQPSDIEKEYIVVATPWDVRNNTANINKVNWKRIVVDEGHESLRNKNTSTHERFCEFKADLKFILSGTPITNNPEEMYSYLRFFGAPGLKSLRHFNKHYNPDTNEGKNKFAELRNKLMIRREHHHNVFGRPILELPKSYISTVLVSK